jgi:hypothetical protein
VIGENTIADAILDRLPYFTSNRPDRRINEKEEKKLTLIF